MIDGIEVCRVQPASIALHFTPDRSRIACFGFQVSEWPERAKVAVRANMGQTEAFHEIYPFHALPRP
jgi:hypothetical protein